MYGLYNIIFNVTILSESLAKELGLPIATYKGTLHQVTGYIGHFIGKPGTIKVQLQDSLELMVGGIRVMAAADNKLQFVLGIDLFTPAGTKI